MLKICKEKWDKNKDKLIESLKKDEELNSCDYLYLVKKSISNILNDGEDEDNFTGDDFWNIDDITLIDNGDYQGTQLFVIPLATYQPCEYQYLMTYVGYGSCSCCDTLQSIQDYCFDDLKEPTDEQLKAYTALCKDIIQNIIKSYNSGWRETDNYDVVE